MKLTKVQIKEIITESGVSKRTGDAWETTSIVVETQDGRWTDSAIIKLQKKVVDAMKASGMGLRKGDVIDIDFGMEARSFTDKDGKTRYTNELYAWNIEPATF